MGDVGAFALILYNRSPGGVGAQLPSSWSSDLGCWMAQQLVKRPWVLNCLAAGQAIDFHVVSWLASACNGLIDCCLSSGWIYWHFGIHSWSSYLVSFTQSQLLAICLHLCIPYFPSLPPSLGSFSITSVQCDWARTGVLHELFMGSLLLGP